MTYKDLEQKTLEAAKRGNFVRNNYWRTWSRVLAKDHEHGKYVEIDLTGVNGYNKVKQENIRAHNTQRDPRDQAMSALPEEVTRDIINNLGVDLAYKLLTHDYMSNIDWGLYEEASLRGGGVPYAEIVKNTPALKVTTPMKNAYHAGDEIIWKA